jgi:hypothetical protein
LESTWAFFIGWPDEPCSGAARFKPANSRAASLRAAASAMATCSPACSGADPLVSAMAGVESWPPRGDEGHMNIRGAVAPDEQ